ncbi:hypothetical protein F5Y14DRAFT_179425 [Nemania sp. NC0429]|nr:hypothetical protein F5Y14DRAFT_179425 [Nemania sp. NC0429]
MRTVGVVAENHAKRTFEKYRGAARIEEEDFVALSTLIAGLSIVRQALGARSLWAWPRRPGSSSRETTCPSRIYTDHLWPIPIRLELRQKSILRQTWSALWRRFRRPIAEEMAKVVFESLVRKLAYALPIPPDDVEGDR